MQGRIVPRHDLQGDRPGRLQLQRQRPVAAEEEIDGRPRRPVGQHVAQQAADLLADRPAAGQRRIGAEDFLDQRADDPAAQGRVEHAAVLVAHPQAVDSQGRREEIRRQIGDDASDAEGLSGDGLDNDWALDSDLDLCPRLAGRHRRGEQHGGQGKGEHVQLPWHRYSPGWDSLAW